MKPQLIYPVEMPEELQKLLLKNKELCRQLRVAISENDSESIWLLDAELETTVEQIFQYEPQNKDEALRVLNTLLDWLIVESQRTEKEIRIIRSINRIFKSRTRVKT